MSGETELRPSGWTVDTLREYMLARMEAITAYSDGQVTAIKEAVDKAEQQLNKRLDGMNEFRETLKDQAGTLATKEEMKMMFDGMAARVRDLENARTAADGRAKITGILWAAGVSLAVVILSRVF